jgi:tryptophanyl-tRNA synthetase
LSFFLESDERLEEIFRDYSTGAMLTGEVKKELIGVLQVFTFFWTKLFSSKILKYSNLLQDMVREHQERRASVTHEVLEEFMRVRPLEF